MGNLKTNLKRKRMERKRKKKKCGYVGGHTEKYFKEEPHDEDTLRTFEVVH